MVVFLAGILMAVPAILRADGVLDIGDSPTPPFDAGTYPVFFPNWLKTPTSSFWVWECDDTTCSTCTASNLTGVTIVNMGTATGGAAGDITGVYWNYFCGAGATPVTALTYAGNWGGSPVWTWAGSIPVPNDACTLCSCFGTLNLYADIGACPGDGNTVALAPRFDSVGAVGGVSDSCNYNAPSQAVSPTPRPIRYIYTESSPDVVAPGDTITYTVYYGKPGTVALTDEWIMDTLPAYTHYVVGSGVPAPDVGWDPDPGPPQRVRWYIPAPGATTGGPTSSIQFSASVDWGNGESFEPGSGDVAAPEGQPLNDLAHLSWAPGSCAPGRTSNVVGSTARRFLFWMIGDNDVLFAPRLGAPDDEMIYSIFIKNMSSSKTWWNVDLWDTVPNELDVWGGVYGFNDPCMGWTMTPSGCAAANPGRVVTGGKTILTWRLDLQPGMTLNVQWRARVQPTTTAGATAITILAVLERGQTGIFTGTGSSGVPRNFVQLANIVLRTTYISYLSISTHNSLGQDGWFINFYPMNRATDFELRSIYYSNSIAYATQGGVSQTIGCLVGDCINGFPGAAGCTLGSGAIPGVVSVGGGGFAGCKAERIPAIYSPYTPLPAVYGNCLQSTVGDNPPFDYHLIFKVTSNSPLLWQMLSGVNDTGNDQYCWDPTTSMSFSGYMAYGFMRHGDNVDHFENLIDINTSIGPSGVLDPTLSTTLHYFSWDYNTLSWQYWDSREVGPESLTMPWGFPQAFCNRHYRVISSQTQITQNHGWCALFRGDANNLGHMCPTRSDGLFISGTAGEAFYLLTGPSDSAGESQRACITNAGAVDANYRIEQYIPRNPVQLGLFGNCSGVPVNLSDTYGSWKFIAVESVPAGFYAAGNPHVYGPNYDLSPILDSPGTSAGMYRVTLLSGGPIQINSGGEIMAVYSGGAMLHPSVPLGKKVGTEFWLSEPYEWTGTGCTSGPGVNTFAVFCPKTGMSVLGQTNQGYSARYTTTGPDQVVTFMALTAVASPNTRNIRIQVTGGNAIAQYNHCIKNHKMFTAPFMETGVHYDILVPPSVFIGQSFWITLVVVDAGGGTKTDYCGTTSFSSTDPGAKIESTGMDTYNFTFSSSTACSALPNEDGVRVFVNVTMTQLGLQTIVASDTADGSITGLSSLMVVGVDVKLTKRPPLQVSASGDMPQFQICWSNYSSTSAFTFVITDAVPMGTTFLPEAGTAQLVCSQAAGSTVDVAYSTSTSATPPAGFVNGNPVAGTRWLRWTVRQLGVNTTGCGCFRVTVN